MIKFPSIKELRAVVEKVKYKAEFLGLDKDGVAIIDPNPVLPVLHFRGTPKMHGANMGIIRAAESLMFQSRYHDLSDTFDVYGFYQHMQQYTKRLTAIFDRIEEIYNMQHDHPIDLKINTVEIYGEWCGKGISKKVALREVPPMFVIFAVRINEEWQKKVPSKYHWLDYPKESIYHISQFPHYAVTIDFNNIELSLPFLNEVTNEVRQHCPVGNHFDIDGSGEGLVWECVNPPDNEPESHYWFKTVAETFKSSKKGKDPIEIDTVMLASVNELVVRAVTEARMEQGLSWLLNEEKKPLNTAGLGDFIRWVYNDVLKEEDDNITANKLDVKLLGKPISEACKRWYFLQLENNT